MSNNSPIGVFDSGVGGLTVVREITRQLPNESIIYFGDTARVPYGNKSQETVTTYSRQIVHFLMKNNVKAIVIACNTASAFALETLKHEIDIPIIGVVKPGAKAAYLTTKNKRIGVIGTVGTTNSKIYNKYILFNYEEMKKRKVSIHLCYEYSLWSEWRDSNSRPLEPHSSALPPALHPDT